MSGAQKCTCGKADATIQCDICLQKAYCCKECKPLGWSIHQDECNVHIADKPDTTVFMPEFDGYDPKRVDGNEEFLQSHIVRYVSPKAVVQEQLITANFQQVVKKLGGGAPVDEDKKYQLRISGGGMIPKLINVIPVFKESRDSRAAELAGQKTYDMSKVVFWSSERVNIDIPTRGELKVLLLVNGSKTGRAIVGDYKLPSSENFLGDFARKVKSHLLKKEYLTKGFRAEVTNTLLTMKASNRNGNMFRFTVQMSKGKGGSATVPIVDVEFATKEADLKRGGWIGAETTPSQGDGVVSADYIQPIKCDASNIDHITALVQAMEDRMASGELVGFEDRFNIINAHREGLMISDSASGGVGNHPKLQSAIHDTMTQLIELSLADRFRDRVARVKFLNQLKKLSTEDEFQDEYDKWIGQAKKLREQGNVASTSLDNARAVDLEARRRGFALNLDNYNELNRGKKETRRNKRSNE